MTDSHGVYLSNSVLGGGVNVYVYVESGADEETEKDR